MKYQRDQNYRNENQDSVNIVSELWILRIHCRAKPSPLYL